MIYIACASAIGIVLRAVAIALTVVLALPGRVAAQSIDGAQLEADRDALVELERQLNDLERPHIGGTSSFDDYQKGLERMHLFRSFYESHWGTVETIFRRYGADLNDLWSVPDTLRAAADRVGLSMPNEISGAGLTIIQKREIADNTKKEVARACPEMVTTYTNERNLSAVHAMYRTRQIGQALAIIDSTMEPHIAQVFQLSVVTQGAQRGGPYLGTWVGNTWQILRERVVVGRASKSAAGDGARARSKTKKGRRR